MRPAPSLCILLTAWTLAVPAAAADAPSPEAFPAIPTGWFVHAGLGAIMLSESARMNAGGAAVPGATIRIKDQVTPVIEIGYYWTPNLAVSFTGGAPPKIRIHGAGAVAGLGILGSAVYGPSTLTLHYRFRDFGWVQPYVGAGVAFMKVFDTKDAALSNLRIDDAFGPALQAGVDFMLDDRWSVFIDVKKAFLRTRATGDLGGIPVTAKVTVDPLVVQTGLGFRF